MLWPAITLQALLPAGLLAWLAAGRFRSLAVMLALAIATGCVLLAAALTVPALFLPWWLPMSLAALGLLVLALRLAWRRPAFDTRWPDALGGWLVLVALCLVAGLAATLAAAALDGRRLPGAATVDIPVPLAAGTYLVANGGSRSVVNAHLLTLDESVERFRAYRGQSYGIDLVQIDRLGLRGSGLQPPDPAAYLIYGRPVHAPCDGIVVSRRSDRPDMRVPVMDREVMEGNHVLLRCGAIDILLAHFMPGSVAVEAGDAVAKGQFLGRVGNSGNSSEPHLHISAQRPGTVAEPLSGEPLPLLLDGRFVARNDRIRVSDVPGTAAQEPAPAPADLRARFAAELEALREQYGLPGATAAYVLPDGTTAVVAAGYADIESQTPMTGASRMLAASIGKTFVSATLLALQAEGVVDLDDRLADWLGDRPWYPRLPNHADVTLRQLMMHSGGIPDHLQSERFGELFVERLSSASNPFPPEELIGFVLDRPALFEAGNGWSYTDTGYILLGMVIEKATGNGYYEEITRRFLEPLGLTLTTPSNRRDPGGLAAGYTEPGNVFGLPAKTMTDDGQLAWHPAIEWTGGGLVSNAGDLALWAERLFTGRAMAQDYLGELLRSVPMDPDTPRRRYGAGVAIFESDQHGPIYGHAGWVPGYVSFMRYLSDERVAIAFQTNTDVAIMDGDSPAIAAIESRLTGIVTGAHED